MLLLVSLLFLHPVLGAGDEGAVPAPDSSRPGDGSESLAEDAEEEEAEETGEEPDILPDISGLWNGTLYQDPWEFPITVNLTRDGRNITGTYHCLHFEGEKFITSTLRGGITQENLTFRMGGITGMEGDWYTNISWEFPITESAPVSLNGTWDAHEPPVQYPSAGITTLNRE